MVDADVSITLTSATDGDLVAWTLTTLGPGCKGMLAAAPSSHPSQANTDNVPIPAQMHTLERSPSVAALSQLALHLQQQEHTACVTPPLPLVVTAKVTLCSKVFSSRSLRQPQRSLCL